MTAFPAELSIPEPVREIARTLESAGHETWCVGGALRDALLGGAPGAASDYDLATAATPQQVQALFRRTKPIGVRFGTVGVLDRDRVLHEVTTFRHDVATDGRHAVVRYGASLEDDLARRDFTVNAIAYHPLRHEWRDPYDGAADLRAGVIRAVGVAAERFREDYLRILRAVRFAARLDFSIDVPTWEAMRANRGGLAGLSAERVRDEWFKGLRTAGAVLRLAELWVEAGVAQVWMPELDLALAQRAKGASHDPLRDPVLLTVAITRDATAVLQRLKASNAELTRARRAVTAPAEPADASALAMRRWRAAVGGAADDLVALYRIRHGGAPEWAEALAASRARGEAVDRGGLAVDGADLQRLGLTAGPVVGRTLDRLLEAVLERPDRNTRDALLALARELG